MDNFLGHLKTVLEHCGRDTVSELLVAGREKIYGLGKEVGLNSEVLGKRLEGVIGEILKAAK